MNNVPTSAEWDSQSAPAGAWGRLFASVRSRGLWGAVKRVYRRVQTAAFERRLGIQTQGSIHADLLGSEGVRFGYQPIDYHSFQLALKQIDWGAGDVFADYGCGMGRAVVLAAWHGFREVHGVELAEELCEIARGNVRSAKSRLKSDTVHIHCADATEFEPPRDLSVLFMYNPFGEDVLRATLEQIRRSLEQNPRRLQVIYALPTTDVDLLAETPWLVCRGRVRTENTQWERMSIYENIKELGGHVDASVNGANSANGACDLELDDAAKEGAS